MNTFYRIFLYIFRASTVFSLIFVLGILSQSRAQDPAVELFHQRDKDFSPQIVNLLPDDNGPGFSTSPLFILMFPIMFRNFGFQHSYI